MDTLDLETTILAGSSIYGIGNYGDGVYGIGQNNYVVFWPKPYGIVWEPDMVICNTDSQSFTTFAVYMDLATPDRCIGNTIDGNQGTVDLPEVQVTANHILIGVWFGGDVGSNAYATLIGTASGDYYG